MDIKSIEKIVSLSKRRGFIFQSSEIYGGLASTWDYGPLGVEMKNNIKNLWGPGKTKSVKLFKTEQFDHS